MCERPKLRHQVCCAILHDHDDYSLPYAVFFNRGIALHGVLGDKNIRSLGYRASGGCVRMSPSNAKIVWELIEDVGDRNVSITVYDSSKRAPLLIPEYPQWTFDGIY